MKSWLNEVTYGNPNDIYLPYLKSGGEYESLYEGLKNYPFPPNDSEATKDEIRELLAYQNNDNQKNEKIVNRYIMYDDDLSSILKREQNLDISAPMITNLLSFHGLLKKTPDSRR